MGTVATIIIESRLLVREALESLMESHSYHFVCGASSAADIENSSIVAEGPKLVVLSALSADNAASEAASIRRLWPDSKVVLLFEHLSPADFQQLIASQLDGCVPLFVSPHTLFSMLDLVMIKDVRVMVVGDGKGSSIQGYEAQQVTPGPPPIERCQAGIDGDRHACFAASPASGERRHGGPGGRRQWHAMRAHVPEFP